MKLMNWEVDEYDSNGKLIVLYRLMRVIDSGVIKPGAKVLDVGGWGKMSLRLTQEGCVVDLFNLDQDKCDYIKKLRGDAFNIICGDIRKDMHASGEYDVVTCFETLEHIMEDRPLAIDVIMRALKEGGTFTGTIPIPNRCHPIDDPTVVFIYPEELRSLLSKYCDDIFIEATGSLYKEEEPSSWYFVATKRKALNV